MHLLNTLLAFINHHPGLAYGAVFMAALTESLALVGLLVPGTVIMFGVGAVVAAGSLKLTPVLLLAAVGAVSGDGISYWLGHHFKERLVEIWPFSRYPEMLKLGTSFFHRHGGKSVLFGRFVGPVRPIIPVVAGMLGMRPLSFSIVNVLSAMGWAPIYILPGLFFGTSLSVAGAISTRLAVVAFIMAAGMWGFVRLSRSLLSLLERKGPVWLAALKRWALADLPAHRFVLSAKRLLSALLFRKEGEELLRFFLVVMLLAAGWGFLGVLQDVLAKDQLVVADKAFYGFFQSLRTPWADSVFVAITELGDTLMNIFLAGAVLGVLLVGRCYRAVGFWSLTVFGGLVGTHLLKWVVHLPRPVALYHGTAAFGFPSGHTSMSVILFGFLAILFVRRLAGTWHLRLFSVVMLITFVIGVSRLYLGAHWLSDVLGGFFFGASWTALLGILYLQGPVENIQRRWLGVAVVLTIGLLGGWHISQRHTRDLTFYAPRHKLELMPMATWRADGWRNLPTWRIDMGGEREQPLTLQWSGSSKALADFLISNGWQRPPTLTLKNFLGMFASNTSVEELPVLPRIHDGRTEALRLVFPEQNMRLVLRLWRADVTIKSDTGPLFIGTVEQEQRRNLADLITMAKDSGIYDRSLNKMENTLESGFEVKRVQRTQHKINAEHEPHHLRWGGEVLLVWRKES